MTPEDIAKASERMKDRLVQTGFVKRYVVDA
jgi:hypothetical protein